MQVQVINQSGKSAATLELADAAFGVEFNEPLVHQVVTAYLSGARSGTKAQKTRAQVRGGGRKPWRQKGTGRARAGTIRSPLWRGGGKVFAAVPRDHSQKVNAKMYRGALRAIVSELLRQGRLKVIEAFNLDAPKTKQLVGVLSNMGVTKNTLILVDAANDNLSLAARNLPSIDVREVSAVDPVSLVAFETVLATSEALKKLEARLQ